MTRIRYKNNNGKLISSTITVGENSVQIELRPSDLSYVIHMVGDDLQHDGSLASGVLTETGAQAGNASNLSALKRKAKQVLRSMGANFGTENRLSRGSRGE